MSAEDLLDELSGSYTAPGRKADGTYVELTLSVVRVSGTYAATEMITDDALCNDYMTVPAHFDLASSGYVTGSWDGVLKAQDEGKGSLQYYAEGEIERHRLSDIPANVEGDVFAFSCKFEMEECHGALFPKPSSPDSSSPVIMPTADTTPVLEW